MQMPFVSDTRLIILGSVLAFSGFLIGGVAGAQYQHYTIQALQFGDCFDYSADGQAIKVKCDEKIQDKFIFLSISVSLISGGVIILVKGVRGKWDQNVKSDEMLGPKK